jgi:hypothetical protein
MEKQQYATLLHLSTAIIFFANSVRVNINHSYSRSKSNNFFANHCACHSYSRSKATIFPIPSRWKIAKKVAVFPHKKIDLSLIKKVKMRNIFHAR